MALGAAAVADAVVDIGGALGAGVTDRVGAALGGGEPPAALVAVGAGAGEPPAVAVVKGVAGGEGDPVPPGAGSVTAGEADAPGSLPHTASEVLVQASDTTPQVEHGVQAAAPVSGLNVPPAQPVHAEVPVVSAL